MTLGDLQRLFLREPVGLEKILACAIILVGASLVTGLNLNSFRNTGR